MQLSGSIRKARLIVRSPAEDPFIGDDFASLTGLNGMNEDGDRAEKRQTDRSPCQTMRDLVRIAIAEETVQKNRREGKHGDQQDEGIEDVHATTISEDSSHRH